jgi:galactokinase
MYDDLSISTPGRICLFGEHQDYLNLPVIPAAISLRISVSGSRRKDSTVHINLPDIQSNVSFSLSDNFEHLQQRDYFRSAVRVLRRKGFTFTHGFDCIVRSKIPIQAGTSSSSALVVSWVNLLAQMSDQNVALSRQDIARFAHEAEVMEFHEAGGMMDQYSTSLGGVMAIDFLPEVSVEPIACQLGTFVLGDSRDPKDTLGILSRVKGGILKIMKELSVKHPSFSLRVATTDSVNHFASDVSRQEFELLAGTVRNHEITELAREMLHQPAVDQAKIGALMNEHQSILRDILKISTRKIDRMLDAALNAGALGGKINGSGGGGCMFAYAPENPEQVAEAIEREGGATHIVSIDSGTRVDNG